MNSLDRFNAVVQQFSASMVKLFPKDTDAITFQTQINLALTFSRHELYKRFANTILDPHKGYKKHIMSSNESFFLENKLEEEKDYLEQSLHLKRKWKTISASNKKTIFKYLKVLVVLAEKVEEEKSLRSKSKKIILS